MSTQRNPQSIGSDGGREKEMKLAQLVGRIPGYTVTWANLISLIEEAETVYVCFYAHNGEEHLGRAMKVPKNVALEHARWAAEQHRDGGEKVNVSAAGSCLFFGGY